ncbi:MAG: substrate-binding periplasmic protein [Pseudomonadota bacterium]
MSALRSLRLALFPLLLAACFAPAARGSNDPLNFHLSDSGAPPWLYLMPGGNRPQGVVADILDEAARTAKRQLRYEFLPRERTTDSLRSGHADGALFFSVTRPPGRELVLTEPLARLDSVLVTLAENPVNYRLPSNLKDRKLCTLTEELYPPLALLSMQGKLWQSRAKTEQAALMILRTEGCVAAILSGPAFRWLSTRYDWTDMRIEPKPLLNENLVLGFAARERDFAETVNRTVRGMRDSGRLAKLVDRWLPADNAAGLRDTRHLPPRVGVR